MTLRKALRNGLIAEELFTHWLEKANVTRKEVLRQDRSAQFVWVTIILTIATLIIFIATVALSAPTWAIITSLIVCVITFLVMVAGGDPDEKENALTRFEADVSRLRSWLSYSKETRLTKNGVTSMADSLLGAYASAIRLKSQEMDNQKTAREARIASAKACESFTTQFNELYDLCYKFGISPHDKGYYYKISNPS